MKLDTKSQRFVSTLSAIVSDEHLPETVPERSRKLIAEMKLLVDDKDDSSPSKFLDHIEYGLVEHEFPWGKERTYGLKVRGTNILLSDAMHAFENENLLSDELPEAFKNYYPELSHEQWQAVIRMGIDVITALDRHVLGESAI